MGRHGDPEATRQPGTPGSPPGAPRSRWDVWAAHGFIGWCEHAGPRALEDWCPTCGRAVRVLYDTEGTIYISRRHPDPACATPDGSPLWPDVSEIMIDPSGIVHEYTMVRGVRGLHRYDAIAQIASVNGGLQLLAALGAEWQGTDNELDDAALAACTADGFTGPWPS